MSALASPKQLTASALINRRPFVLIGVGNCCRRPVDIQGSKIVFRLCPACSILNVAIRFGPSSDPWVCPIPRMLEIYDFQRWKGIQSRKTCQPETNCSNRTGHSTIHEEAMLPRQQHYYGTGWTDDDTYSHTVRLLYADEQHHLRTGSASCLQENS